MDLPYPPDATLLPAAPDPAPDPAPALRLEAAAFTQVVDAVDRIGANRGEPAAIALYRNWIAANAGGAQMLHGAPDFRTRGAEIFRQAPAADNDHGVVAEQAANAAEARVG